MKSISRVYRIIAWPICNQCLNLWDKILMSVCAQVSKFGSSVSCKQSKFSAENGKCGCFEQKVSTDAEDSQVCLWYCILSLSK